MSTPEEIPGVGAGEPAEFPPPEPEVPEPGNGEPLMEPPVVIGAPPEFEPSPGDIDGRDTPRKVLP